MLDIRELIRQLQAGQSKVDPFVKTPKVLFLKCISPLCEMGKRRQHRGASSLETPRARLEAGVCTSHVSGAV